MMRSLRHTASALLVTVLVLLMGAGNTAYALAMNGVGGHCGGHLSSMHDAVDAHADLDLIVADSHSSTETSQDHSDCDRHLCPVLSECLVYGTVSYDDFSEIVANSGNQIHVQERLDCRERPPNSLI